MTRTVPLGRVFATPGALNALAAAGQPASDFLDRHSFCDWGNLDEEDKHANDVALDTGGRILSAYLTKAGDKLWIITEADRSSTCILLPEEY